MGLSANDADLASVTSLSIGRSTAAGSKSEEKNNKERDMDTEFMHDVIRNGKDELSVTL